MPSNSRIRISTKFYQQDIVQQILPPHSIGIVLRCWHDAEDIPYHPASGDPLMRPLQPGEVGVSFLTEGGEREILLESDLKLVDRTVQPGDFCKRAIDETQSGIVTDIHVKSRLEHAISREAVEGWKTLDDLMTKVDAEIGDYVVFDDWIGQVIELYDDLLIESSAGQLIRLPELSSRLSVGEKGNDILPNPSSNNMYNILGYLMGAQQHDSVDTVLDVKHTVYAIAWLAVSQLLDPTEAEKKDRPQRFWHGKDLRRLTLIRGRSDAEVRVGDRVRLKDNTGAPSTTHGEESNNERVNVQTFLVVETQTSVDILWQDGTRQTLSATDVVPYLNPDEYDCWPGDHVIWRESGMKRHAIVQSVNAGDRTALILLTDTGKVELAPLLELDPHGTSEPLAVGPQSVPEGLGVRRGDFVFIHRSGTTNGLENPAVPRIGELEAWVSEGPVPDGQLLGWRKEMADIGADLAARCQCIPEGELECQISRPTLGTGCLSWLGEVTDLHLDGTVEVTHPDSAIWTYPLERLTKLYDGIAQLDSLWVDDAADYDMDADNRETWSMDEDGVWRLDSTNSEWEDYSEDGDNEDHESMDLDDCIETELELRESTPDMGPQQSPASVIDLPGVQADEFMDEDQNPWKRFNILPSAPLDHAFISSPPAQPSKSFLGRLTKEYRILSDSLPDSILVRAYEDRTDLLRSLILGPANTPYEDAPFMIDWMLDSNFPHTPPIAHFHSWTNGNGRVNPNLYEDGKVCLSILGTWAGDKDEIWSAARSSLLQAFVSIQGLVLVKEPWFCEPAYDKLRGTEEGIVNSRLYNEKAYVLSRAFVLRALEIPLGGLEFETKWLYFQNRKLAKVLQDAQTLIASSKAFPDSIEADQDLAVPRLTAGGIITLERTLSKLQILLEPAKTDTASL